MDSVTWVKRPFSLTLSALGMLAWGAYLLVVFFTSDVEGTALDYLLAAAAISVQWGCGIGLLRGREWARLLWLGTWGASTLASIGSHPAAYTIVRLVVLAVWARVLFRPAVSDYITSVASLDDPVLRGRP